MEITCLKKWWEDYVFLVRSLQTAANARILVSSCLSVRSHVISRIPLNLLLGNSYSVILLNLFSKISSRHGVTYQNTWIPTKTTGITSELASKFSLNFGSSQRHRTYNTARVTASDLPKVHPREERFGTCTLFQMPLSASFRGNSTEMGKRPKNATLCFHFQICLYTDVDRSPLCFLWIHTQLYRS
jgi:hypothetical protein